MRGGESGEAKALIDGAAFLARRPLAIGELEQSATKHTIGGISRSIAPAIRSARCECGILIGSRPLDVSIFRLDGALFVAPFPLRRTAALRRGRSF